MNKKIKTLIAMTLVASMVMGSVGCKKNDDPAVESSANTDETSIEATETTIPEIVAATPDEAVESFISLLASGDYDNAMRYIDGYEAPTTDEERAYVDTIMPLYSAFLSGMEYELTVVRDEADGATVFVTGSAPDINSSIEDIYSEENASQMMAYQMLEEMDTSVDSQNSSLSCAIGIVINGMSARDKVDFVTDVELITDSEGNYMITSVGALLPEFSYDPDRLPHENRAESIQEGLEILLEEGLITEDQYSETHAQYLGEGEVYDTVNGYIESVAIPSLTGGQGPYCVDIRPTYLANITYNIQIVEVSADSATVIVSGTVPDVNSALAGLNSPDVLTSVMTDAVSTAINSGSIGSGESYAISAATGMILNAVAGSSAQSFSTEVNLTGDGQGNYTVVDGAGMIPNNLGAINNYSLSDGEISAAASRGLANLYSSGVITEDEYIRYSAYV